MNINVFGSNTIQNVEEGVSISYVRAIASSFGFQITESGSGERNGWDIRVCSNGFKSLFGCVLDRVTIDIQVKASYSWVEDDEYYKVRIRSRQLENYRARGSTFLILVLLVLPKSNSDWMRQDDSGLTLHKCAYYLNPLKLPEEDSAQTQMVWFPKSQIFNQDSLLEILVKVGNNEDFSNI